MAKLCIYRGNPPGDESYDRKIDFSKFMTFDIHSQFYGLSVVFIILQIFMTSNDSYFFLTAHVKQIKKMKLAEAENSAKMEKTNAELREKIDEYKKVLRVSEDENAKLSAEFKSKVAKNEKIIIEREREISKLNDMVVKLEETLNDRNKKIKSLEAELKESESIKETVLKLFNKKR